MPSRRRFLATLGTTGSTVLAGCIASGESAYSPGTDVDTEWPMPAYDRGFTAYNPDAAAPRDGVTERWSTDIPRVPRRPVIAAGTVLVTTASGLVALDVESGEERWRYGTDEGSQNEPTTAPVVHDATAYVGVTDPQGLLALEVETGIEQWHVETAGHVGAVPTFGSDHESLYAGDDTGVVYRLDPTSGEVTARTEVFGSVQTLAHHHTSLLTGTWTGEVYAFSTLADDTFVPSWRRKVVGNVNALADVGGQVYVGTARSRLYRLETSAGTGSSRWEAEPGSSGGLAVASRDVVVSGPTALRMVDSNTGDVEWKREGEFTAAPAIAGDAIYVGGTTEDGSGFVAAYPLSGGSGLNPLGSGSERLWEFDVGSGAPVEGIAVADGAVFACTEDLQGGSEPRVYALDSA